ncbi:hypothetical protein Q7P37_003872 [Cladosporium fusiforme]
MSQSTAYSHFCSKPDCRSFSSPRFRPLTNKACLTVVCDSQGGQFAYYSQKKNILALYKAPKPLLLVPQSAVAAGFEPDDGKIKLNKATRQGSSPAKQRNRSREKIGPSRLRFEVLPEEVAEVPSSPAAEEASSALRELSLATSSLATTVADEAATDSPTTTDTDT